MTNRKPKSQWNGEAEIWINEERQLTATVQLTKYEEFDTVPSGEHFGGRVSWRGLIVGPEREALINLHPVGAFELRLKNGRAGWALLEESRGILDGVGQAPFD